MASPASTALLASVMAKVYSSPAVTVLTLDRVMVTLLTVTTPVPLVLFMTTV